MSAQPTGILGTRLKPSRQRALSLGLGSFALAGVLDGIKPFFFNEVVFVDIFEAGKSLVVNGCFSNKKKA